MTIDDWSSTGIAKFARERARMMISRRTLLAVGLSSPFVGARALASPKTRIGVNALGSLWDPNLSMGEKGHIRPGGEIVEVDDRVIADARAEGLSAIGITVGFVTGSGDPHEETLKSLARWDGLIAANPSDLLRVTREIDFATAKATGRVGLIYGFQNAVQIGGHLDRVDLYAKRGVRVIQLTYNDLNVMGGGSAGPETTPLTPLGHRLVEKLNDARVIVDLSHSGRQTCLDALAVSTAPISINHTGCRALSDLPRNKSDAELRGVARKGGFVGIYFNSFLTLDGHPRATDAAHHIVHALNICGEDHVGIGTDGPPTGIDDLAAFSAIMAKDTARRIATGVAAKGEAADTYPFVVELRDVRQFQIVADLLTKRGVRERVVDKVLGRNYVDFAGQVWG